MTINTLNVVLDSFIKVIDIELASREPWGSR